MKLLHLLLATLTLGPVLLWLLAIVLALFLGGPMGCEIHEGFANPCTILGLDLSETAYSLGMFAAWGSLLVAPVVLIAGALWLVLILISALLWVLRRRQGTS
ncbi:MAG: hypothetical protein MRY77_03075 [Rhodobacteraceae bacterium]|jgi:hypothetical protein|nr:hypothetical protein [Paracoccaceae bacterium]